MPAAKSSFRRRRGGGAAASARCDDGVTIEPALASGGDAFWGEPADEEGEPTPSPRPTLTPSAPHRLTPYAKSVGSMVLLLWDGIFGHAPRKECGAAARHRPPEERQVLKVQRRAYAWDGDDPYATPNGVDSAGAYID